MNLIPLNFFTQGEQTPLRRMMLERALAGGGGALSEYEITGNPVAFNTNVAKPLSAFTIPFLPIQSGTGDPSPSNVRPISGRTGVDVWRTGKNILDPGEATSEKGLTLTKNADGSIGVVGTPTGTWIDFGWHDVGIRAGAYMLGLRVSIPCTFVLYYYLVGDSTRKFHAMTSGQTSKAITFEGEVERVCFGLSAMNTSTAYNFNLAVQLEVGSIASLYTPYVGQSYPVTFPATGKNLLTGTPYGGVFFNVEPGTDFAKTTIHATYTQSGNETTLTTDSNWYGCVFATGMLSPGTYNIHTETSEANCRLSAYVTDADLIVKNRQSITANNVTITLEESARIAVIITNLSAGSVVATNIQVESGNSYTGWEPFTNTVYGGTLDAVNGVLTVEWGSVNMGSLAWELRNNGNNYWFYSDNVPGLKIIPDSGILSTIMCEMYKTVLGAYIYGGQAGDNVIGQDGSVPRIRVRDDSFNNDADAFKTAMNGIMLYFELATPYEIPLSDIPVPVTLIGDNTIWTDTNGENTVKYLKKG